MKHILFILVCLTILVACNSKPTSTPVPEIAQTASVLPTTTYTSVPNTDTPSPENTATSTLLPTETATLPPADTPLPTQTPTPPPPSEGVIAFLWDPDPPSFYATPDLYFAWPGSTPGEWQQEVVVAAPNGFLSMFVSPDKTKLVLTQGDGTWTENRVHNNVGVYLYDLIDGFYGRLNDQTLGTSIDVAWLPDSQSITYAVDGIHIYQAFLDGSPPRRLTSVSGVSEGIFKQVWSPDGRILAFESLWPDRLFFYYADTGELVDAGDPDDFSLDLSWSPDSQWLAAFNYNRAGGLFVINAETLEKETLVPPGIQAAAEWAPGNQILAFTQRGVGLFTWDVKTGTLTQLTNTPDKLTEPNWSPDGSYLVVGCVQEDEEANLLVVNLSDSETHILTENVQLYALDSVTLSPNGQWILLSAFTLNEDPQVGGIFSNFYLLNRLGGEIYQGPPALNIKFPFQPQYVLWLPAFAR